MLKWFTKEKVDKKEVIELSPVVLSSFKTIYDGVMEFKVTRGKSTQTFRVASGDRVEIYRPINIDLTER